MSTIADQAPLTAAPAEPPAGCPVCHRRAVPTVALRGTGLRRCRRCRHVWAAAAPQVGNDVFESEGYVRWRTGSDRQARRQAAIARQRVDAVADLLPAGGRALELGCSTGEVVRELAQRGWAAYGLDLSEAAVRVGVELHRDVGGVRLGVGTDPVDAGFPAGGYDLVAAFHVVEHLPDLAGFADLVDRHLAVGGLVYLRVPNFDAWSRRVLGADWPDLVPEHLHHFSPTSLERWLQELGLEPVRIGTRGEAREWAGGLRRTLRPSGRLRRALRPSGRLRRTLGPSGGLRRALGPSGRLRRAPTRSGGRRVASPAPDPAGSCPPVSPRALAVLAGVQRVGRPWFRLEERYDAGSELVAVARRTAPRP